MTDLVRGEVTAWPPLPPAWSTIWVPVAGKLLALRWEVRICRGYACKMFLFPGEGKVPVCQGGIPRDGTVLVRCASLVPLASFSQIL